MKVEIRRSRATFPAIALSFLITFLMILAMARAVSRRVAVREAAFAPPAPETGEITISGGEYAFVSLGAYERAEEARLTAARLVYRGSAGYLYRDGGETLVFGNAYATKDAAEKAASRLKSEGIPASVVYLRAPDLPVRLTATRTQSEALLNIWESLARGEAALCEISRRLDAGEIDASAARAQLLVVAYESEAAADEFSAAAKGSTDALICGVRTLSDRFVESLSALASGGDRALYLSSRVKHALISSAVDRLSFLNAAGNP